MFIFFQTMGEGWHNYHHVFPWDYRSEELASNLFNLTTLFIDLMAKLGQVSDRKIAPKDLVLKRMARTGDKHLEYTAEIPKNKDKILDEEPEKGNALYKSQ